MWTSLLFLLIFPIKEGHNLNLNRDYRQYSRKSSSYAKCLEYSCQRHPLQTVTNSSSLDVVSVSMTSQRE